MTAAKQHFPKKTNKQANKLVATMVGKNTSFSYSLSSHFRDFLKSHRLTGSQPHMSVDQEEKLCAMVTAIEVPFSKHGPPERKNFLSFSYCLYKFCEMLGYREFLPRISLPKRADKLCVHDAIFEEMCRDLGWEFIPSAAVAA
jgi:hypothetical protein